MTSQDTINEVIAKAARRITWEVNYGLSFDAACERVKTTTILRGDAWRQTVEAAKERLAD